MRLRNVNNFLLPTVCNAKDAGFIQFDNLPGLIKTRCTATPAFKNRYCTAHVNQACTLQNMEVIDEELDEPVGPTLRSLSQKKSVGDPVAETILAKKMTRKQAYYQVILMHVHMHICMYVMYRGLHVYGEAHGLGMSIF